MSFKSSACRTAAGIVLIGATLTSTFEVGASSSSELYAETRASAAELTAEFRRELLLELEASTRPTLLLEQDGAVTAQAAAGTDPKDAQEDS